MRFLIATFTLLFAAFAANAGSGFDTVFNDSTLRVDYIFGGGPDGAHIFLDSQSKTGGWYGKRFNLDRIPLQGNGSISIIDPTTGDTLYTHSFSSLFQEWINTPEAGKYRRSFENTFLLPLPRREADIVVTLLDNRHRPLATATHRYSPADELVARPRTSSLDRRHTHRGADPKEAIDVAIIAEGYSRDEAETFYRDAQTMTDEILSYEPFASRKDKFNFIAVMSPSNDSGVSVPLAGDWKDTAFGSHYSTFHSDRYLTAPYVARMHDALTGLPYEHIIVLANTDTYGGGGIYNSYLIAAAHNVHSLPVTVHEFGHSFGGLGDEYFYDGEEDSTYPLDIEPWEPNITTLVNFDSKWRDMLADGVKIPTPWHDEGGDREKRMKQRQPSDSITDETTVGVYEGGGYRKNGIYRSAVTCRMRDNFHPTLCPVCRRAVERIIDFYTKPLPL